MKRMSQIPPELLAEMLPAVLVFVESHLIQMAEMRTEIEELKSQIKRLTPQNSSLTPSTKHPHSRPTPKPKTESTKNCGGIKGAPREQIRTRESPEPLATRDFSKICRPPHTTFTLA